jgi:hypothetical protein
LPFSSTIPASPNRNPLAARAVRSPTTTWPGSAACSSLAATLTASPVAMASPGRGDVTASTSPVFTPVRMASRTPWARAMSSFSEDSLRRILIAARRALAGSSSWAAGTPKAAITASPMNFSTVPPSASISSRIAAKKLSITSRRRSASSRSPSSVDPETSANRIVTSLRSSPPASGATSSPQDRQNRASVGRSAPHLGHASPSGAPHRAQNRASSRLFDPQEGHAAMRSV